MSFINKNSMDIDRIKNFSAINNNNEKISSDANKYQKWNKSFKE
jgi:hypothetical protein